MGARVQKMSPGDWQILDRALELPGRTEGLAGLSGSVKELGALKKTRFKNEEKAPGSSCIYEEDNPT